MAQLVMSDPNEAYRRQKILTASPVDLIVMLFDGLKKNIVLGRRSIDKGDASRAHTHLMKAQAIISELMNSLDMNYEMSGDLYALYEFILHSLGEINTTKQTELCEPLLEIVTELRDTWQTLSDEQKGLAPAQEGLG